jgi:hypothetical protein
MRKKDYKPWARLQFWKNGRRGSLVELFSHEGDNYWSRTITFARLFKSLICERIAEKVRSKIHGSMFRLRGPCADQCDSELEKLFAL